MRDLGAEMEAYLAHVGATIPSGSGERPMRCPFHDDSHASASVNLNKGLFHCNTCDASGDAIALIIANEGTDHVGAFRILKEQLGITVGSDEDAGSRLGVPGKQGSGRTGRRYVPPRRRAYGSLG